MQHGITGMDARPEDKVHFFKITDGGCTVIARCDLEHISCCRARTAAESSIEMCTSIAVQSAERDGIARCCAAARSIAARYDARDRCVALKHELIVRCTSRCCHINGAKNIPGPYDAVDGQLIIVHIARCGRVDANGGKR